MEDSLENWISELSIRLSGNGSLHKSNSSNSIRSCASPATYLLSFDNSTAEPKNASAVMPQPRKRVRRSSQTQHHIIAERKRRQELTGSIIALSATIPGLKKFTFS
ncbi:Transcription factor bHLH25, partial [Mucuna pruriens]